MSGNASADSRLSITAPGDVHPFANVMALRSQGFDETSRRLDFGPGLSDPDAGNWEIRCSTTTNHTIGAWGHWVVWGD